MEAAPTPLGPRTRRPRPFPRVPALLVGAGFVLAVANPAAEGSVFRLLDVALKLGAALSACLIAGWAEKRVFTRHAGYRPPRRIAAAVGVPVLALLLTPILLLVLGVSGVLMGDDGTLAVSSLVGCVWFGSAGLGSLVVLVLEVSVSALVPDLRTRFQAAVLGLLAISVAVAMLVFRMGEMLAAWFDGLDPSALEWLGESGRLAWLARPEAAELLTALFFACAAAIALPAVLSACDKLAEMVMVRIHPLRLAFRSLAQGDFDARVEEAGPRELEELGRSFNQMAGSLVEAREEVQRLNEELETEVATRTRELRAALDELQEAQTRLVETEKHAMLSRLTAGLLHEVNSPLGALRSATDTIRRSSERILSSLDEAPSLPATQALLRSARASASLSEVVVESTHRIEELMDRLGQFVSLDSAERKTVDLRSGLEVALSMVRPFLAGGVVVAVELPSAPLLVSCFPSRLNQVFLNLLENAAQAVAGAEAATLRVAAVAHEGELVVTIADDGRGMAPQQLERLFDFGFTKKESGRMGLRLGLPSSKRWLEEIGGAIEVDSALGKGTTVSIRLPCASVSAPPAAAAARG